ncbi:MAG: DUF4265 domain-containing protein [Candidatus Competibacteraceae bacterium]
MKANAMKQEQVELLDNEGRKELVSASQTGEDLYQLDSTPSFAYQVSLNDIVRVMRGEDGQLRFVEVVEKSGNRTVRVLLNKFSLDSELGKAILAFIAEQGCQYGNAHVNVLTITAPPEVDLQVIETRLVEYGVWWEYADPLWDQIHGND